MIQASALVESLFPDYYIEEGENLLAFTKAYYEWLEQSDIVLANQLLELRDIDTTVDEFLRHFKQTYLANIPEVLPGNARTFIKNINSFYEAKGSPEAIKLLLRVLFNVEAEIYLPGDDVFMTSAGTWKVPIYLEVTISSRTREFIGRQIFGATSGATAIVESVVRRQTNGKYYDVIYLSNLVGSFAHDELIADSTGLLIDAPVVIGSLNEVIIINGGANNNVGDIFAITSVSGKQALARVVEIENATGRVQFTLVDGGTGYSTNAHTIVSEKLIRFAGSPSNSNSSITNFLDFEEVEQVLYEINFLASNNNFTVGDNVKVYTSGTWIEQANGIITDVSQTGANGVLTMYVANGDVRFGDVVHKAGNTIAANIANTNDQTATGIVVGANSSSTGIYNIDNTFKALANSTQLRGKTSNTYANVQTFGSGSGADFDVGSLTNTETIYAWVDALKDRNTANVPFMDIRLDGYGSGRGVVNTVTINSGGTGYTNGAVITFSSGGDIIGSVNIVAGGSGYKNGEHIICSTGVNSALSVSTNSSGGITSVNIIEGGRRFITVPTLTVNTTVGTGANLVAVLGNPTTAANATITTNSTGGISSTTIVDAGAGYFTLPNLSVSGGTGANLSAVMNFGYGFIKAPSYGVNNIITSMLRTQVVNVGTIFALSNVSPGESYNHSPFVKVVEPLTAGLDRRNLIIQIANAVGAFAIGETISQSLTSNITTLTYTGISGNSSFDINEVVSQNSNAATGIVFDKDSTTLRLRNVSGTFVNTSNSATQITGLISNAVANTSNVATTNSTSVAKGEVVSANTTTVVLKRRNINLNFDLNIAISGGTSQATANVISISSDANSLPLGFNANVSANVQTANGVASLLEVTSSGFGFTNGQLLTLQNSDNDNTITGIALLQREGRGEGFFTSTKGYLSEDQYLYDGEYYQTYSYDIQTSLSLDRYADILKGLLHVAGTRMFGTVKHNARLEALDNISVQIAQGASGSDEVMGDFSNGDNSQLIIPLL